MTGRFERGVHDLAWPGAHVRTHETIAGPGTWEIIDHPGCRGDGHLQAMAKGNVAPPCPQCDREVTWQLTHLAASVAADHRDVGRLP